MYLKRIALLGALTVIASAGLAQTAPGPVQAATPATPAIPATPAVPTVDTPAIPAEPAIPAGLAAVEESASNGQVASKPPAKKKPRRKPPSKMTGAKGWY